MVTSKVGSVPVELEVTVSGVMRVDEWVEVRINWCINIVIVNSLSNRSSLLDRSSNLYRGNTYRCRGLGNKGSSFLTSSSSRNMSSFKDSEPILTSSVADSDGLSIIINIAVLANSFPVNGSFLPENSSIFLSKSCSMSSITSIESLLLQNLCILWLNKLTASSSNKARGSNKSKHCKIKFYTLPHF